MFENDIMTCRQTIEHWKMLVEEEMKEDSDTGSRRVTWTCRKGIVHNVPTMDEGHLFNLVKFLERNFMHKCQEIIAGEAERRITGNYPEGYDALLDAYAEKPEWWRLKVNKE